MFTQRMALNTVLYIIILLLLLLLSLSLSSVMGSTQWIYVHTVKETKQSVIYSYLFNYMYRYPDRYYCNMNYNNT